MPAANVITSVTIVVFGDENVGVAVEELVAGHPHHQVEHREVDAEDAVGDVSQVPQQRQRHHPLVARPRKAPHLAPVPVD